MKQINSRGEVITVGLIAAALIIGILGFVVGASGIRKFVPGFGGHENKTRQVSISHSESKPIFVTDQKTGQQMVLMSTKTEVSNSELSEEQKLSLWQKLMVLPKLWLFLMVLGIFFPPVAAIMGGVNRKLWGETRRIVGGVEESLKALDTTPDVKNKVLDTLSKKFDSSTKSLVADIKRTL